MTPTREKIQMHRRAVPKVRKKGDSKSRDGSNLCTRFPKDSSCEVFEMTKKTEAQYDKAARRHDDLPTPKKSIVSLLLISKSSMTKNGSLLGHKIALCHTRLLSGWLLSCLTNTIDAVETSYRLRYFVSSKKSLEQCARTAHNNIFSSAKVSDGHMTTTRRIEVERTVRRVREGTVAALVRSDLLDNWWDSTIQDVMKMLLFLTNYFENKLLMSKRLFRKDTVQTLKDQWCLTVQ